MFEYDKQILYNLNLYEEKLPKVGLHRCENHFVDVIAFFVANSQFQHNLLAMFKE